MPEPDAENPLEVEALEAAMELLTEKIQAATEEVQHWLALQLAERAAHEVRLLEALWRL